MITWISRMQISEQVNAGMFFIFCCLKYKATLISARSLQIKCRARKSDQLSISVFRDPYGLAHVVSQLCALGVVQGRGVGSDSKKVLSPTSDCPAVVTHTQTRLQDVLQDNHLWDQRCVKEKDCRPDLTMRNTSTLLTIYTCSMINLLHTQFSCFSTQDLLFIKSFINWLRCVRSGVLDQGKPQTTHQYCLFGSMF